MDLPPRADILEAIARQHQIVDARLTHPARWRGLTRKELRGRVVPADRTRVALAFDRLGREAEDGVALDLGLLLRIHRDAVGEGRIRSTSVRVGQRRAPRPRLIEPALEQAIEWAETAGEPAPLAAARLHLNLLLIHPFADGNGRSARLAAAFVLMRAGYRSTLLTAVEQHFSYYPRAYMPSFTGVYEDVDALADRWLDTALKAMADCSAHAAWLRGLPHRGRGSWEQVHGSLAEDVIRSVRWQATRLDAEEREEKIARKHQRGTAKLQSLNIAGYLRPRLVEPEIEEDAPRPAASVVVLAYRAADTIAACLQALQGQDLAERFETIVVSSGKDATADIVRRNFPRVRLLHSNERLTTGSARNSGITAANGEVIAFLAADCIPDPDWLRRRVEVHRAGHAMVGGTIEPPERSSLAGWAEYFAKFASLAPLTGRVGPGVNSMLHLSYSRDLFDRYGGFPESTTVGEDTIFNYDLLRAGERVYFDGGIVATHLNLRTWREVRERLYEQGYQVGVTRWRDELDWFFHREWLDSGWRGALRISCRSLRQVARYRGDLLLRCLLAFPLLVAVRRQRLRGFTDGYLDRPTVDVERTDVREVLPTSSRPRVSVLVAAYNEQETISRCLDALLAQTWPALEVVVADDGSTDRTAAIAATRAVPVLCMPHGGPARARNAAADVARGDVLVFIDADLELESDCIERLVGPVLSGREIGTFTKDIYLGDPASWWAQMWRMNRAIDGDRAFPERFPDRWTNFRTVARSAFVEAGGFEDVGYGEDHTLAPKLRVTAGVVPGAVIKHHVPGSLRENWQNASWIGRGPHLRSNGSAWMRHLPWNSMVYGLRVARRNREPRFVAFRLLYDAGVLWGLLGTRLNPKRHWK